MEHSISLRKVLNISNLLLVLGAVYYFHWYEASVSSIDRISNVLLLLILSISAVYTVYSSFRYRLPHVYFVIAIMLFVFFIYGFISILSHNTFSVAQYGTSIKTGTYFIAVFRSFLPFFAFYVFTRKGYVTEKSMLFWALFYLITSFLVFYLTRQSFIRNENTADLTYNVGYLFVVLIPFCFIIKRPLFRYSFLLVNLACIFVCMKRGAIACGLVAALMIVYKDLKSGEKKRVFRYFVLLVFIIIGIYLLRDYYYSNSYFQRRLELTLQGNSSGRGALIDDFRYYFFKETSLVQILFGSGADATLRIGQDYAHNDWWEILIDQGLFGLTIYFIFWVELFKSWRKSKTNPTIYSLFGCCFVILLLKTLFSMSYSMISFPVSMCLGYCLAQENTNE